MISMPAMRPGFDRAAASAVRLSIAAAMVIVKACLKGIIYNIRLRPTFAKKCQQRVMTMRARRGWDRRMRGETLASDIGFVTRARLEFAYFSGYALIMQRAAGGAGVVLRFQRVRPRRGDRFQPLKSTEITPEFLDRTIRALKRWKYDIVSMDEACRRAVTMPPPRRFVCLTFDGAYKDLITSAYPVLSRHRVPFAVYVPTAFPDGVGEAWWLALEAVIARENRISLVIDRKELHFDSRRTPKRNISSIIISRAGCARSPAAICRRRSTISASDIRSIWRRCRARPRWTGTIWRGLRPIRW